VATDLILPGENASRGDNRSHPALFQHFVNLWEHCAVGNAEAGRSGLWSARRFALRPLLRAALVRSSATLGAIADSTPAAGDPITCRFQLVSKLWPIDANVC